ncbi:MAG: beta strand repeat-containing protein, partial [Bacteroidales bacterium]
MKATVKNPSISSTATAALVEPASGKRGNTGKSSFMKTMLCKSGVFLIMLMIVNVLLINSASGQIYSYTTATNGAYNSIASNMTATGLGIGAGLTDGNCNSSGQGFDADGWPTTTVNITTSNTNGDYIQFTITPNAGYYFNITGFTADLRRQNESGSNEDGPTDVRYAFSTNGTDWTSNGAALSPNSNSSCTNTGTTRAWASFTSFNSDVAVILRIYGFTSGSNGTGDLSLRNVTVSGSVLALPANPANPTSNSPQCITSGVTLTRTGTPPGGETWYWQTSASGTDLTYSGSTYNVSSSGTYYIRSRNNTSLMWSSGAGSLAVTVDPVPTASAGGSQTICITSTATVSGASAANGTIQWTENGAGSITSGGTGLTPIYTPASGDENNAVTLTMTVTSNNSCAPQTAIAYYTVNVKGQPTASAGGSKSICYNATYTLVGGEASSTNGNILWTENGAGDITAGGTTLTPTYTPAAGDIGNAVTLTMTVSNPPCNPATATYTINVDGPIANAGPATTYICKGGTSAALGGSASGTATGGTWDDGGVGGTFNPSATDILNATWTPPPSYSGTANLTLTTSGGSCGTTTASKTQEVDGTCNVVTLTEPAALTGSIVAGSTTICNGQSATITLNISGGTPPYTINGSNVSGSGPYTFQVSPTSTTTYDNTGNFILSDANSCSPTSYTGSYTVNVDPLPLQKTVAATAASVCYNAATNITVAASESGVSYQLRNNLDNTPIGSPLTGDGSTINLPTGNLLAATTFNVLATRGSCPLQMTNTPTVTVYAAQAATDYFRSKGNGNYSSNATWERSYDQVTWCDATAPPTYQAALITIQNGHTVTVDVNSTASTVVISGTLNGGSGTSLQVNGDFGGTGSFTCQTGTIEMNGSGAQSLGGFTYNNLNISNTGGTVTAAGSVNVNGTFTTASGSTLAMGTYPLGGTLGTISHSGKLTTYCLVSPIPNGLSWGGEIEYWSGSGQTVAGGNYTTARTQVAGNYTAGGNITASTLFDNGGGSNVAAVLDMGTSYTISGPGTIGNSGATIRFGGATNGSAHGGTIEYYGSNQTVGTGTYSTLVINQSAGDATLGGPIAVATTLNMLGGLLISSPVNLVGINAGAVITGYGATRYISGPLMMTYTGAGSMVFPTGKGGNYRPVTFNYSAVDASSSVTIEQFESSLPGTPPANTTVWGSRHWTITQSGASTYSYYVTLDGTGWTPVYNPKIIKGDGSTNTAYTVTSPNYTNTTAFTSFSYFGLGETSIFTTTTADNKSVCYQVTTVNLTASVSPDPGGGTVEFFVNGSTVGTSPVVSGVATRTYDPSSLSTGGYTIKANFSGNGDYVASSSDPATNGTLTVNELPVINTHPSTGTQTVCLNQSLSAISVEASAGSGTLTQYEWFSNTTQTNTGGISVAVHTSSSGTDSYTPSSASAGELYYYVVVTNSNGCTKTSNVSGKVTVNVLPVPSFTVQPDINVCANTQVIYTTQASQSNYTWMFPGTASVDYNINSGGGTNDNSVTLTYITIGPKTLTVNYTNGVGCTGVSPATNTTTVNTPSIGGSVTGGTTPICLGNSTGTMTLSGHTGSVVKWQKRVNSGVWTDISNTNLTYSETPSSVGTWDYMAVVQNSVCSQANSNPVSIVVNTVPAQPSTITGSITPCQSNSYSYSVTNTSGVTYAWSYDGTNVSITSGQGTNSITADYLSNATSGTWTVTPSNVCGSGNARTLAVTVNNSPTTSGVTICTGGSGALTSSYTCPSSGSTNTGYLNAGTGVSVAGTNTDWSNPGNITTVGTPYATCVIPGQQYSDYLMATNFNFNIPANATIDGIEVEVNRTGTQNLIIFGIQDEYVYLVKDVSGSPVIQTAYDNKAKSGLWPTSLTTTTYGASNDLWSTPLTPADINNSNFGLALRASCNRLTNDHTATVDYFQIRVTYTVPGSLNWYTASSGGSSLGSGSPFNPVGVGGSGLPNTNTAGTWTYYAECSTDPGCRTPTNFVIVDAPTVDDPADQVVDPGDLTDPVNFTGTNATSYSWTNNNTSIGLAASGTGDIAAFTAVNPTLSPRIAVITVTPHNATCSGSTQQFTIIVNPACDPPSITQDPSTTPQSHCLNAFATPLTITATGDGLHYQWYSNINPTNSGGNPVGTDNDSYTPSTATEGTLYYYCVVSGDCTPDATSNVSGGVTVRPIPTASIGGTISVCQGSTGPYVTFGNPQSIPVTVTYNINGGGDQTINIGASTTSSIQAPTGTSGDFTYNLVSVKYQDAPLCSNGISGSATITVNPTSEGGTAADYQAICSGSTPADITLSGYTGSIQWQSSTDNVNFSNISGATSATLTGAEMGSLTQTTWYRAEVTSGVCPLDYSSTVEVYVALAGEWIGSVSSDWFDGDNWCGGVPTPATDVIIRPGKPNNPVINGPGPGPVPGAKAKNINIKPGGQLRIDGANRLIITGDWLNDGGIFNPGNGILVFDGKDSHVINRIPPGVESFFDVFFETTDGPEPGTGGISLGAEITQLNVHDLTLGSGSFDVGNADLEVSGNWYNNSSTGSFNPQDQKVTFKRKGDDMLAKVIGGSQVQSFFDIFLDNVYPGDPDNDYVSLGNEITVTNNLVFTSGQIRLGEYDLIMGAAGEIIGAGATQYVVTNGSGALRQNIAESESTVFPIGLATSYLPATVQLNAGSVQDNISARVDDGVYTAYDDNDAPDGYLIENSVVGKTWYLREETPGGSDATVTYQWNASDELPGFNRDLSDVGHFVGGTGGTWSFNAPTIAAGTEPYTQTRSGITSFSPFIVPGQDIFCLPLATPFCAGSNISVFYLAFGGSWGSPNTYSVELSDASGNWYATPLYIGAVNTSFITGVIPATVPANTATGTGYRMRIASTNPVGDGTQSGALSIYALPTVAAGGPDVVCQSATPSAITLSGSSIGGGASTGTWSITNLSPPNGGVNGTLSNTGPVANPATVTYTPPANYNGTITLTLTTDDPTGPCTAVSATRTVTVQALPSLNIVTPISVNEAAGTATFTVNLSAAVVCNVSFDAATASGTATSGSDFTGISSPPPYTITAGNTSTTVTVNITDDFLLESTEYFFVNLTNPVNATIGTGTGQCNITDNDVATVSIAANDADAGEPANNGQFTVTQTLAADVNTVLTYSIGGSAAPTADYTPLSGTVTILAGNTTATIDVSVVDNTILEATEDVIVTLTGITSADADVSLGTPLTATVNITDNDVATVSIAANDADAGEPANNGQFTVTQTLAADVNTVLTYSIGGSAAPTADYTPLSGTVTILAGNTTATIDVSVVDNTILEATEDVIVTLTGITSADADVSLGTPLTATVNITDNDVATVSIAANDADAGEPANNGQFTVTQTLAADVNTVLAYSIGGSAAPTADYTPLSGTVTILAGNTTATIDVSVVDNTILEATEDVIVTLTGITSADADVSLGTPLTATVNITDNDVATVSIAANDADAGEPANNGQFTVTQTLAADVNTVLAYSIGGSAAPTADYTPLSGTVTILAGNTTATIDVSVVDNTILEATEDVIVTLTGITSADADVSLGTPLTATVNITDNDVATVSIAANDADAGEPSNNGQFTVTQTLAADVNTVLAYSIGGSAAPTADYTPLSGTVTILAGNTTATIDVSVVDNTILEATEDVIVTLTGITSADADVSLGTPLTATVNITDNDVATVSIAANDADAGEPSNNGQFTVTQTLAADVNTVLTYSIGGSAAPTADYTPLSGTVTILAGNTTATIDVSVVDNTILEATEDVIVTLTGITSADADVSLGTPLTATVNITDNDVATVSIAANDADAGEPANNGQFTVTQTLAADVNTVLAYSIGGSAAPTADYTPLSGTVTILAGNTTATIDVSVVDNTILEATEDVIVTLTGITSADADVSLGTPLTATVNITDNDVATVSIAANDADAGEPANNGQFTVTQTLAADVNTVLAYSIGGSAAPTADYTPLSGTVTILAGNTTATIDVSVVDNTILEATEDVIVTLTGITSADADVSLGTPLTATVNITDNDVATVSIAANDADAGEPSNNGQFTVTQTLAADVNTVLTYSIGGSAAPTADYTPLSGTVTILAGNTTATIDVSVVDNTILEATEDVIVTLTGITSADADVSLGTPLTATVNITDNDVATVSIAANDADAGEPSNNGQFTVTQTLAADVNTVLTYSIGGSAAPTADYTPLSGTVTILAGNTTATIDVSVVDNTILEATEDVIVTLTGITSADADVSLGTPLTATVNITDNDVATVSIAANDADAGEPANNGQFTVTQTLAADVNTVLAYSIGGSAAPTADYTPLSGTVTILAGNTTATIDVSVVDNTILEATEDVIVTLTGITSADADVSLGTPLTATVNITDNDVATVSIAANDADAGEPANNGQFTVTQTLAADVNTVLAYSIGGSAAPTADYTPLSGTVTILAGNTTATIDVSVVDNTILEATEDVIVTLTGITSADADVSLGTPLTATVNITDNDVATVSIAANDADAGEPSNNGQFTVTQTLAADVNTVLTYSIGGSAAPTADYTPLSGTVTILAGNTTATIDVSVVDNTILEATEDVIVTLTGITSADADVSLGTPLTATVNITDNDVATVSIAANDADAGEPANNGQFTVTQTLAADVNTVLAYSIGGSAAPTADYTPLSGTVTILAGNTTATIDVSVVDNTILEATEDVIVTLTGITSADADVSLGTPLTAT